MPFRPVSDGTLSTALPEIRPGPESTYTDAGIDAALARGLRSTPQLPTTLGRGIVSIYMPANLLNRDSPLTPNKIPDNLSGSGAAVPVVMGRVRTVALPYWVEASGDKFNFMYIVGEGEINDYKTLFVDGVRINVSATTPGTPFTLTTLQTAATCTLFVGTSGQNVATSIAAYAPNYTDACADYAVIFLQLPSSVVQRAPRVEVIVEGQKIKDHTTAGGGSVAYTDNLGNMLIHWVEIVEGRTIDTTSATTLADACAEDVGNGTSRRVGGLAVSTAQPARNTRGVLRAHAATAILDTGAKLYFIPDRPAASVMDIGPDQIIGGVTITGPSLSNRPDDVIIHWYNPDTGKSETARATNAVGGNVSEVRMPGINTAPQAKREAVERYNHLTLEGDEVQFTMGPRGVELEPGDVVRLTDARVGLADKPYRLMRATIPQVGLWSWAAREYQPNAYSNTVQGDPETADTDLDNPLEVPDVAGLTLTAQNKVTPSGIDNQMKIEWTAPTFAFVAFFLVDVLNDDTDTLEQQLVVPADATETVAAGLVGGQDYEIKIRIQSTAGALGDFVSGFETAYHHNLLALYKFESGSQLTDAIGTQDFIAQFSGDISEVTGKVGSTAAEIDCTTNLAGFKLQNSDLAATNPPWTMAGWFKVTTLPASGVKLYLFGQTEGFGSPPAFILYVTDASDIYLLYNDLTTTAYTDTGKNATTDQWHFMALQYHEGGFVFILDDDQPIYIQTDTVRAMRNRLISVGLSPDGIFEVDQFRIYRAALTGQEIEAIRAAEA